MDSKAQRGNLEKYLYRSTRLVPPGFSEGLEYIWVYQDAPSKLRRLQRNFCVNDSSLAQDLGFIVSGSGLRI